MYHLIHLFLIYFANLFIKYFMHMNFIMIMIIVIIMIMIIMIMIIKCYYFNFFNCLLIFYNHDVFYIFLIIIIF